MVLQNSLNRTIRFQTLITQGSDATGDIYYRDSNGALARLGIGSTGQVLSVSGGIPAWQNSSGGIAGPGTSTDRAIATWDGTGGTALRDNPNVTIDASGNLQAARYQIGSSGPLIKNTSGNIEFRNSGDTDWASIRTNRVRIYSQFGGTDNHFSLLGFVTGGREVFFPNKNGTVAFLDDLTLGTYTASETIAAGALVNIWVTGGNLRIRNADRTIASNAGSADGFVLGSISNGATGLVYSLSGLVITGLSTLTIGTVS